MSAAVHIPDPSGQADRALVEGTTEHFTRVCRGHASQGVQLFRTLDRDFHVPGDGLWMVNGLFAAPGEARQLVVGDVVTYHRALRAEGDDRPTQKLSYIQLGAYHRADPVTGRRIRVATPERAIAEGRRRGLL